MSETNYQGVAGLPASERPKPANPTAASRDDDNERKAPADPGVKAVSDEAAARDQVVAGVQNVRLFRMETQLDTLTGKVGGLEAHSKNAADEFAEVRKSIDAMILKFDALQQTVVLHQGFAKAAAYVVSLLLTIAGVAAAWYGKFFFSGHG